MHARRRGLWIRRIPACLIVVAVGLNDGRAEAQPPSLGPASSTAMPAAVSWPTRPPSRIYVVPFAIDPALREELQKQASLIPQGPVRQMISARPRVTDMVTGFDRSQPPGVSIAKLVADDLTRAGYPIVFWTDPAPPPADGWRLGGQVAALDEGSAVARNAIGFGAGNKSIGIDVGMADITQQQRLAGEIAAAVSQAINQRMQPSPR